MSYKKRTRFVFATCLALFAGVMAWRGGLSAFRGVEPTRPAPAPSDIRFRVDFEAAQPAVRMSIALPPGYAFVPRPGAEARITAIDGRSGAVLEGGSFSLGAARPRKGGAFSFTVPRSSGAHPVIYSYPGLPAMRLVCLVPFEDDSADGRVDGVRIGAPPDPARGPEKVRRHRSLYVPPRWFVRLEPSVLGLSLSPAVRVGDLVCPSRDGRRHVSFAPVDYGLIRLVTEGRRRFSRLHPGLPRWSYISWYRTPTHNRREGGSRHSRHMYGDACDMIIDADGDGRMDDLNGDGRVDRRDALLIARVFEDIERAFPVRGGIGVYEYPGAASAGAAVHVDARGYRVRWGYSWLSGRKRSFVWYDEVDE